MNILSSIWNSVQNLAKQVSSLVKSGVQNLASRASGFVSQAPKVTQRMASVLGSMVDSSSRIKAPSPDEGLKMIQKSVPITSSGKPGVSMFWKGVGTPETNPNYYGYVKKSYTQLQPKSLQKQKQQVVQKLQDIYNKITYRPVGTGGISSVPQISSVTIPQSQNISTVTNKQNYISQPSANIQQNPAREQQVVTGGATYSSPAFYPTSTVNTLGTSGITFPSYYQQFFVQKPQEKLSEEEYKKKKSSLEEIISDLQKQAALMGGGYDIDISKIPKEIQAQALAKASVFSDMISNPKLKAGSQAVIDLYNSELERAKQLLDSQFPQIDTEIFIPPTPDIEDIPAPDIESDINLPQPKELKTLQEKYKELASSYGLPKLEEERINLMKGIAAALEAHQRVVEQINNDPDYPRALAEQMIADFSRNSQIGLSKLQNQLQIIEAQIEQINERIKTEIGFYKDELSNAENERRRIFNNLQLLINSGGIASLSNNYLKQFAQASGIDYYQLKSIKDAVIEKKVAQQQKDLNKQRQAEERLRIAWDRLILAQQRRPNVKQSQVSKEDTLLWFRKALRQNDRLTNIPNEYRSDVQKLIDQKNMLVASIKEEIKSPKYQNKENFVSAMINRFGDTLGNDFVIGLIDAAMPTKSATESGGWLNNIIDKLKDFFKIR